MEEAMVEEAMGAQALRLLATLNTECDSVDQDNQIKSGRPASRP
jgi:hypothetical protein